MTTSVPVTITLILKVLQAPTSYYNNSVYFYNFNITILNLEEVGLIYIIITLRITKSFFFQNSFGKTNELEPPYCHVIEYLYYKVLVI
jgi:hypothetical protein